jgi:hypothetical protein
VERPFAVELDDGLGRGGGEAEVGYDVLAGVVAFGGTGPEEEAVEEGWSACQFGRRGEGCEELDARIEASPSAQFSILQTWMESVSWRVDSGSGSGIKAQVPRRSRETRGVCRQRKLGRSQTRDSWPAEKQIVLAFLISCWLL